MDVGLDPLPPYRHSSLFPLGEDRTPYRHLTAQGVRAEPALGSELIVVSRDALRLLAQTAFVDINHLLRPTHLEIGRAHV